MTVPVVRWLSPTTSGRAVQAPAQSCPNRSLCKHTCRASISQTSSNICTGLVTGLLKAINLPPVLVLGLLLISICSQHCTGCERSWGCWAATDLARKSFWGSRQQTQAHEKGILAHLELSCGTGEEGGEGAE